MKSTLWIPCYNEGTHEVVLPLTARETIIGERHTIYETLNILAPKIDSGLFHSVIISNDGSTDDTLDGINKFQREHNFRDSIFRVLGSNENQGKMARFFEAWGHSKDVDSFVMTDGDMLLLGGGDTFEKLSRRSHDPRGVFSDKSMLVSRVAELTSSAQYDISDQSSSGTRSLLISRTSARFKRFGINSDNLPGKGYGLEYFLNSLFSSPDDSSYVNSFDIAYMPVFLKSFRKGSHVQITDIRHTASIVDRILKNKML